MQFTIDDIRMGYVALPINFKAIVREALLGAATFFDKEPVYKQQFINPGIKEWGYYRLAQKESYALRNCVVPSELCTAIPCFDATAALAMACLQHIASQMHWDFELLRNMTRDHLLPEIEKSSTVFRILHYDSQCADQFGCQIHQDLGLLSIVFCTPTPALEIYDYQAGEWLDIEAMTPPYEAIVMVGETLAALSNGFLLPCTHRVRSIAGRRISIVFQLRVDGDAMIDTKLFESPITGNMHKHFVMTGNEFYEQEIKTRTSVNGSY